MAADEPKPGEKPEPEQPDPAAAGDQPGAEPDAAAPDEPPLLEDFIAEETAAAEGETTPRRTPWASLMAGVARLGAKRARVAPAEAADEAIEDSAWLDEEPVEDEAPEARRRPWTALAASLARLAPKRPADKPAPATAEPTGEPAWPVAASAPDDAPATRRQPWARLTALAARAGTKPPESIPAEPAAQSAPRLEDAMPLPEEIEPEPAEASSLEEADWPAEEAPAQDLPVETAAVAAAAAAARQRPRRWPWYVLGAAAFIGVIVVAGVLYLPRFVEGELLAMLKEMGFADATLSVETVGTDQAVVRGLRLGPEATADEVVATFTLSGIQDGKIERVTIRGLRAKLTADKTGPLFGSLDAPVQALFAPSAANAGETPMPVIVLEDAVLEIATPLGPATVRLAGEVTPIPETDIATALGFDVQAEVPLGRIVGRLEATVDTEGGIGGSIIVTDGALAVADRGSTSLAGYVQFVLSADGNLAQLVSNLNLTEPAFAGAAFTTGTIRVELSEEIASLNLLLDDAADKFDLRSTLVVQEPFGASTLSGSVETTVGPGAPVWAMAELPEPTAGRLRAKATVSASLPAGAVMQPEALLAALLAAPGLAGSLQLDLDGMAWPELGEEIFASGGLDLTRQDGGIVATVPAEILAEITPAPALLDALGLQDELRQAFEGHSIVSLGFAESLLVLPREESIVLSGRPLLTLIAPGGQEVSADVWGTVTFGRDGTLKDFRIDAGRLSALGLEIEDFALTSLEVNGSLTGTPEAFAGTLRVAAQLPELSIDEDVKLDDVDLLLDCELALAETQASLRLTGSDSRLITRIVLPDVVRQTKPVKLSLRPHKDPFLAMDWGPPEGPSLAFDLSTGPLAFTANLDTDLPLPARLARTDLMGAWSPQTGFTFTAITDGSGATMPTLGLEATGVWIRTDIDAEGITRVRYRMASLTQGGESPYIVPLEVSGSVTVDDVRVRFDAEGRAAGEGLVLKVAGQHRLDPNTGEVDIHVEPIAFVPGGLQPADLFPPAVGALQQAEGKIAADGHVGWSDSTEANIQLALEDLTLTTPQVTLTRLNGVVILNGVDPLSTPPHQEIAIGSVDLGLPLTDGVLVFQIEPGNKLRIERARLTLAGGEVSAAPALIDWASGTQAVKLLAHDVGLQALLDLADIDGLKADGKLTGTIPVIVQGGQVIIRGGELVSQAPGVIAYAPEQEPGVAQSGESMDLVLDVLRNFHYNSLRLGLERDASGDMDVAIQVDGNNPEVYDGYPVKFNLNVTGKLDEILNKSLEGYRIPDRIQERLTGFQD